MKYIVIIIFLFAAFNAKAQTKDSTAKDTVAQLTYQQALTIINFMQLQSSGNVEVKKETWNELMQIIGRSIRVIDKPKKEQPKK